MHNIIKIFIFFLILTAAPAGTVAFEGDGKQLVTINGITYSTEDFRRWWDIWKEDDTPFPDEPDIFVEWQLLANHAKSLALDKKPSYQRKVNTYLKARSIMLLKREEVDSKIDITENAVISRYNKLYSPSWQVEILYFETLEMAKKAHQDISAGLSTFEEIPEKSGRDGKAQHYEKRNIVPIALEKAENWRTLLSDLEVGEIAPPFSDKHYFVLLKLNNIKYSNDADYQKFKESIRTDIVKERAAQLTQKLIDKLRKKYEVKIDEDLLQEVSAENFPAELLDSTLVFTNRENFPARILVEQLRKDLRLRTKVKLNQEQQQKLKEGLLHGFINHKIALWESLDRHFEKKPPLLWSYGFYRNHRLIKELEKRFYSEAIVKKEEVNDFYEKNKDMFTSAEKVKIAIFKGNPKTTRSIWLETLQGKDFFAAAKQFNNVSVEEIAFDRLDPVIKGEAVKLVNDEISKPFQINNESCIIKLLDRTEATILPFDQAKRMIEKRLKKEKFSAIRNHYLAELKAKSSISVNDANFQKLKDELGKKDDAE